MFVPDLAEKNNPFSAEIHQRINALSPATSPRVKVSTPAARDLFEALGFQVEEAANSQPTTAIDPLPDDAAYLEGTNAVTGRADRPAQVEGATVDRPMKTIESPQLNEAFFAVGLPTYDNGYNPVPLKGKKALIPEWPGVFCASRPSREDIDTKWSAAVLHFKSKKGPGTYAVTMDAVGLACHNGLNWLDCETDEVLERVLAMQPHLKDAPICKGEAGGKILVRSADNLNYPEWNLSGKKTGGRFEILAHGKQGAIPPTLHPDTKQPYVWLNDRTPLNTPIDELPIITAEQIRTLRDEFVIETPSKAERRTEVASMANAERIERKVAEYITWNGCPIDFARDMDAMPALDFNDREVWRKTADAIAKKYGTYQPAWDAWEAWAKQWVPKGKVEVSNADMRAQALANAQNGRGVTVGWLIDEAKKQNWDATLGRWPGIRISKGKGDTKADAPASDASFVWREAHQYLAVTDRELQPLQIRLIGILHVFWNNGEAWPSIERLMILTGASRDRLVRALSDLEKRGYLATVGYGLNGQSRFAGDRLISFTPPYGMSMTEVIAHRNYGRGCNPDLLEGPRCPDADTLARFAQGQDREGGHVPIGTSPTVGVECVVGPQPDGLAQQPGQSGRQPPPAGQPEQASGKTAPAVEPCKITLAVPVPPGRANADHVEPEHRTTEQWLLSSHVPVAVANLASKSSADKTKRTIAADLLAAHNAGLDNMDTEDALREAINAITWDHRLGRNHPLHAIPLRSKPGKFLVPGDVLIRLRERFVLALAKHHNLVLPDFERIEQERQYRMLYRQQSRAA